MINDLNKICTVKEDVDLKDYNTFRLESKCMAMVFPDNFEGLLETIEILKKHKTSYFVIGNGSNIILPEYYDGVIINLSNFNKYEIKDNILTADCGCMLNNLASKVTNLGYAGLDFATGIPGTIGGSIYGNAGCFGSSMSNIVESVTIFDGKKVKVLNNSDMKFGYRTSLLKDSKNKWIILSCTIKLSKGNKDELKALVLERTNKRIATQDLTHPSNGSMFRNPEGYAAGKLIDDLGLKGYKIGDAMVSNIHANFIINDGNATSEDIIKLVDKIKSEVKKNYNIDLVLEQEIIK